MACCEVGTSAYDLFDLIFTHINHADLKRVCIRMSFDLFDLSDNDIMELVSCIYNILDLNSSHSEVICDLLISKIFRQIDVSL